jgi:serine-type D-Ala-D-Ala carboxypeptidase/endopeptidase (penicillin-binding protein 4)
MLDLITLSMFAWLNLWSKPDIQLQPLELFPWHNSAIFELPVIEPDLVTENMVQTYLKNLAQQGIKSDRQGIWIQSSWNTLASHQGTKPLPAASLTKIATTLSALNQWGTKHQFATNIYTTGEIKDGILTGDLIIEGNGDPLFVWEEAIALGNALNKLGLKSVQGNLLVTDKFYMNYQEDSQQAGELLKQSFEQKLWQSEITTQYLQMPLGTSQPEIAIARQVKSIQNLPATAKLLLTHQSLPLSEILKQMNIYSNNQMAQMLADLLGGSTALAQSVAEIANFPPQEIELINGSGLGEENRISPRAICQMLLVIDKLLLKSSLKVTDLFPTAGRDLVGTVQNRDLPTGTSVKTGTLDNVSALAGVISSKKQGNIYFSIINYGHQYDYFRQQQDWFLNELAQKWPLIPHDFNLDQKNYWFLGDPKRNKSRIN